MTQSVLCPEYTETNFQLVAMPDLRTTYRSSAASNILSGQSSLQQQRKFLLPSCRCSRCDSALAIVCQLLSGPRSEEASGSRFICHCHSCNIQVLHSNRSVSAALVDTENMLLPLLSLAAISARLTPVYKGIFKSWTAAQLSLALLAAACIISDLTCCILLSRHRISAAA